MFCNSDYVEQIYLVAPEYLDLATNAGVIHTSQKATILGWSIAQYNPKAINSIFSDAEMAKCYQITYDSEKEDAFVVYLPDKQVKFLKTKGSNWAKFQVVGGSVFSV
jgi:hypothetical protein